MSSEATPLADRIRNLDPAQRRALLERLGRRAPADDRARPEAPALPHIQPRPEARHRPFPLTDIQQAYWIGRQSGFDLGNVAAHGYLEVDCPDLDLARLEAAFNDLIRRHDMLRAVITPDGRQRILADVAHYALHRYPLAEVEEGECNARLEAVRQEMAHQVLDAATWPLFDLRASLLPQGRVRLHISIDVLIFDAHSFDLLSEELRHLYQGGAPLAPLDLSYADYVAGLEQIKDSPLTQQSLDYWRQRLACLPPAPQLPLARQPSSIVKPHFTRRSFRLTAPQWSRLQSLAQGAGVTPSVALLTAYARVLARWSASRHFTLNLTLFNRLPFHPQVNDLVGDFTSVMLLEVDLRQERPFADQARTIHQRLWQDMDHRYVSGVRVLRELMEHSHDAAQMPVVFTSALHGGEQAQAPAAMSWLGEIVYTLTQTPQVWLDHQVTEDAGELVCDWDGVEELFPAGMLDDMAASFRQLLETLAADPAAWQRPRLELLPPGQCHRWQDYNATAGQLPDGLLHTPVLDQARRTPQAPAVIDSRGELSFGQLAVQANALARELWHRGVTSGELVGVLLPKGREQVVAVLGILEAGAVYVPIETSLPAERIRALLELAGVAWVVSTPAVARDCDLPQTVTRVDLPDGEVPQPMELPQPLPAMARPTDPAYIIYTSGSTGTPKGVVIDHRGALNTVADLNQRFAIDARDRVLALSALNFDLSVYDIFGLLAAGGALVLPDPDRQRDPAHWAQLIQTHRVTVWNTVPALMDIYATYLHQVAETLDRHLRLVMMSGDWIPLSLPEAIGRTCPEAQLMSLGGATEASIWSILYPIERVDPQWRSIPYGRPLRNQRFYVLDEHLQPCPLWVPGELYIGGVGVALGYWRDPARTGAAFIGHPDSGERLYRTGDLGRLLGDGQIEFLGRKDFQVKINGYRVELGEIEQRMLAFDAVRGAVVDLAGAAQPGRPRQLVGYYLRQRPQGEDRSKHLLKLLEGAALRQLPGQAVELALHAPRDEAPIRRASQRTFSDQPVPLGELARLLAPLVRREANGLPKYAYASAGGLYPVQTYLHVTPGRVEGLAGGMYYYHPVRDALISLTPGECLTGAQFFGGSARVAAQSAFQILLVMDRQAIEPHYGADSHAFGLLEAGEICQLLEDRAAAGPLGLCQMGGMDFAPSEAALKLERPATCLHCLVGGIRGEPAAETDPLQEDKRPFEARLRAFLKEGLPDYMVPPLLMELEQLPLSANGKVDRKALPAPRPAAPVAPVARGGGVSPWTRRICQLWQETLGVERVEPQDNFFDLGGTSVEMIKIHTVLAPQLPRPVSLVDMFFGHPTIAALVAHLEEDGPTDPPAEDGSRGGDRRQLAAQRQRRRSARQ